MFNNPKGWNKTKIDKLEDIIDSELDEQAVDFDQWEDEINANNTPADANETSVVYSVSGSRKTSKYDYLLGDLEKVGKTPEEIADMSPEELEKFRLWLLSRTEKS